MMVIIENTFFYDNLKHWRNVLLYNIIYIISGKTIDLLDTKIIINDFNLLECYTVRNILPMAFFSIFSILTLLT